MVRGKISLPKDSTINTKTIFCQGTIYDYDNNHHLWLVVRLYDSVEGLKYFPKEPEIVPDKKGAWSASIFEDGFGDEFSLLLYAVQDSGQQKIENWLEEGAKTGSYKHWDQIPYARPLDSVMALRAR